MELVILGSTIVVGSVGLMTCTLGSGCVTLLGGRRCWAFTFGTLVVNFIGWIIGVDIG